MSSDANTTWATDIRFDSRSTRTAWATRSKGASWCASASRTDSRTLRRSSRNEGAPDTSARTATVFTKNPMSPSYSGRLRSATGVITAKSS